MKYLHYIVIGVVAVFVVAGLYFVGSPSRARSLRFDDRRISDLQSLQSQILWYWQQKKMVPSTLDQINLTLTGYEVPKDPLTMASYEYRVTGDLSFELCATFALPNQPEGQGYNTMPLRYPEPYYVGPNSWEHAQGRVCFSRTINKEQYDKDQAAQNNPPPIGVKY